MIKVPAVELGATDKGSKTEPRARPQASQTKIKGLLPTVAAPVAPRPSVKHQMSSDPPGTNHSWPAKKHQRQKNLVNNNTNNGCGNSYYLVIKCVSLSIKRSAHVRGRGAAFIGPQ